MVLFYCREIIRHFDSSYWTVLIGNIYLYKKYVGITCGNIIETEFGHHTKLKPNQQPIKAYSQRRSKCKAWGRWIKSWIGNIMGTLYTHTYNTTKGTNLEIGMTD